MHLMAQEVLFHIRPSFADAFSCKAGECRHSCCKGWEIDVDDRSLTLYRQLPGAWRERMDAAICEDETGAHFVLTAQDACPFLRQDGLCDLILAFGEDALCDICALHPRFYELIGPYELSGLGLSCEAVCELLLAEGGELQFLCEETGESFSLPVLLSRLGFLPEGSYAVTLFRDGPNADRAARDFRMETASATPASTLCAHLAPGGGWVARLERR